MGRANNERPSCSSNAQKIVRSVIGIQQKSFDILILLSNPLLSRVLILDTVLPTLGYLSSYVETPFHQASTERSAGLICVEKIGLARRRLPPTALPSLSGSELSA